MSEWRRPGSTVRVERLALGEASATREPDVLAAEEPLEVRVRVGGDEQSLAITMRTPGNDFELAAGFLLSEGVVAGREDLGRIEYCVEPPQHYNVVTASLRGALPPHLAPLERRFTVTSACGVCGKASLDLLHHRGLTSLPLSWTVSTQVLLALPEAARSAQGLFRDTGGLHAAALFDLDGRLLALREDVGRHNALDKLIGWAMLGDRLPAHETILLVSGRASFELVQKAVVAGIPLLAAVSAPSSLAVETARRFGMTLVGFLRPPHLNVYSGEARIS